MKIHLRIKDPIDDSTMTGREAWSALGAMCAVPFIVLWNIVTWPFRRKE